MTLENGRRFYDAIRNVIIHQDPCVKSASRVLKWMYIKYKIMRIIRTISDCNCSPGKRRCEAKGDSLAPDFCLVPRLVRSTFAFCRKYEVCHFSKKLPIQHPICEEKYIYFWRKTLPFLKNWSTSQTPLEKTFFVVSRKIQCFFFRGLVVRAKLE